MLTAEGVRTRRTIGEVCPRCCKMGWKRAVGVGHGGQGGEFAAAEAITALLRLPVGLRSGYSSVDHGRMGRLSGKCRLYNACGKGGCWTTSDERASINQGDYAGYYAKACSGGDAYACSAYGIATDTTTAGHVATNALIRDLYDFGGVRDVETLQSDLSQIRLGLATAYADYLPQSEANAALPSDMGIARLHWDVFAKFGLPASTFGGTPLGRGAASVTAPLTAKYVWPNWCPNCR